MIRVNRQLTFLFCAFALLCVFLYAVSNILLPFVLGILVAYLLDPVVDRLEARRFNRGYSSAFVLVLFYSIIATVCILVVPLIMEQIEDFIVKIPKYYSDLNQQVIPAFKNRLNRISPMLASQFDTKAKQFPNTITQVVGISLFGRIFQSSLWLINLISLILITPVVSFYLLRDWDLSLAKLYALLPQNYAPIIKKQARKIDDTISAFLRGQLTICILLGVFYAIALSLVGLNFGFIIGLATGMLTFIPYIGLFVGGIGGILIALLQYGDDWKNIGVVALIFAGGAGVEGTFITPRLMGNRIAVHPAWLIFGMLAGGSLLGFLGVLISVPMTAIVAVLLRFAIENYEQSSYYLRNRNVDQLQQPVNYKLDEINPPIKKRRMLKMPKRLKTTPPK